MKIVVGACLGIALFASQASAECAWVLWEDVTISRRGGADQKFSIDQSWNILRTYDAGAPCREDYKKLMAENSAWYATAGERLTRIDDGVYGELYAKDGRELIRTVRKRAFCIPDTIDPRGPIDPRGRPKGK